MDHGTHIPLFREAVIFLAAAGIIVPLFHRLRLSPVLGFLAIGLLIGPYGLARFADALPMLAWITIGDIDGVRLIAEFGVLFLLFMIGLELSFDRLWRMRRMVFGFGLAQVAVSAAILGGLALPFGHDAAAATVLGLCFALSSTAIVMQLLVEQHRTATPVGRAGFAVLLMQDLAVVPILFLAGVLAAAEKGGTGTDMAWQLGKTLLIAVAAVAAIAVLGRRVLGPLFRSVGATHSPELFMALTLLVVIVMAAATGAAGLSTALGAFLAGLLLSESEYRHAVEVSVEPFKGLLLGLFFLSVGMGIDLSVAADHAGWLLLAVVGLMAVKAPVIFGLALLFGQGRVVALELALLLWQAGEFVFVVVALSERLGLLDAAVSQFMLLVASVSMLLTPFVAAAARRLAQRLADGEANRSHSPADHDDAHMTGHVVICGFGRVGRTVAALLDAEQIGWIALDSHAETVAGHRARGLPVHYGDAGQPALLGRLGAARALALVVTVNDPAAAGHLVAGARQSWPALPIVARARDEGHAEHLRRLGATEVIAEAAEASLQLGGLVLGQAGLTGESVRERLDRARGSAPDRRPSGA